MRPRRPIPLSRLPFVGVLLAGALGLPAGAVESFAPVPAAPAIEAVDATDAVVRITDTPWLDRELTRFAAALGRDPKPMRRLLAESLYHTKSLDGIDIARPAVFIWRKNAHPLQAIIPILATHRRQFVEEFGVMGAGEAPLVRVGDRDGTVVYTQNHADGLREYRLLVMDSVAFLAHTADDCRKLAARAGTMLPQVGSAAPVTLTCTGDWLRASGLLKWSWSPRLPLHQWLPWGSMIETAQAGALGQVEGLTLEIRPTTEGRARLAARVSARPESEFAAWIATQQNVGNRLRAQVGGPDTAVRIDFHAVWQDKLEVLANAQAETARTRAGDGWTAEVDESWTQMFSIAQRAGDAVWTLEVPEPGRQVQTLVIEQPRNEEGAAHIERVARALTGVAGTPLAVTGHAATRRTVRAAGKSPALAQVIGTTSRQVLLVDGWNVSEADVLARAEGTARRLQQSILSAGEPAVAGLWCNVGRLVRLASGIDTEVTIPDAVIQGSLRVTGVNSLQFDLTVPLSEAASALGHLPDEGAGASPRR